MASVETTTTLNGLYKEVYADKIKEIIPESHILLNMDNFVSKEQREGNKYHQPIVLAYPTGATWGLGNVTLNTAIASTMGDAQIAGSAITHRDLLSYDAAAKAAKGGKQSFAEATGLVVKNLIKAESKFLELDLLYGGGTTAATGNSVAQTTVAAVVNATTTTVTVSYGTWAPAIFAGMEGAIIQFYNAGTLVGSPGTFTISSINVNVNANSTTLGGTITVTGTAGDNTALVALTGTTLDVYFQTQKGQSMFGLRAILANTGSLFNIDSSAFNLWQANTFDCQSTQLTFGKLQSAVALAVNRGLAGKVKVLVSPNTFANLVDEQAGSRVTDTSYDPKKGENGTKALQFYSSNGIIEIVPHIFMRWGEAYIIPEEEVIRVGPIDGVTNTLPGMPGEFFVQSATTTAYELRCYANQAIFIEAPAHGVLVKNIVNV